MIKLKKMRVNLLHALEDVYRGYDPHYYYSYNTCGDLAPGYATPVGISDIVC